MLDFKSLRTKSSLAIIMTNAMHAFVGDAEQSDDLTMMAIQYIRPNK